MKKYTSFTSLFIITLIFISGSLFAGNFSPYARHWTRDGKKTVQLQKTNEGSLLHLKHIHQNTAYLIQIERFVPASKLVHAYALSPHDKATIAYVTSNIDGSDPILHIAYSHDSNNDYHMPLKDGLLKPYFSATSNALYVLPDNNKLQKKLYIVEPDYVNKIYTIRDISANEAMVNKINDFFNKPYVPQDSFLFACSSFLKSRYAKIIGISAIGVGILSAIAYFTYKKYKARK